MNLKELAEIKKHFVAREVGNEMILVPLTNDIATMNELFTLNETAKIIWENLDKSTSMDELKNRILDEFEIDEQTVTADIDNFLKQLEKLMHRS